MHSSQSHLELFPLHVGNPTLDHVRLKQAPVVPLGVLMQSRAIASNLFLSVIPFPDPSVLSAFEQALAVFTTMLFEPCENSTPPKPAKTRQLSSKPKVTSSRNGKSPLPAHATKTVQFADDSMDIDLNEPWPASPEKAQPLQSAVVVLNSPKRNIPYDPEHPSTPQVPATLKTAPYAGPAAQASQAAPLFSAGGSPKSTDVVVPPPVVPKSDMQKMATTIEHVFLSAYRNHQVTDASSVTQIVNNLEDAFYYYREVYQPAFPADLPAQLPFPVFVRAVTAEDHIKGLSAMLESSVTLHQQQAPSTKMEMLSRVIAARVGRRGAVAGVILLDPTQTSVLLITSPNSSCWSFPSKSLPDKFGLEKAAMQAAEEGTGLRLSIQSNYYVEATLGGVYHRYFLVFDVPMDAKITSLGGLSQMVRWWRIEELPLHVIRETSHPQANIIRLPVIISRLKDQLKRILSGTN